MKRLLLLAPLLLAAMPAQDSARPFALATLNIQIGGARDADGVIRGGAYQLIDRIDVPADHTVHDTLIAFEGPGWESDRVAYRLYLDERNVPDVYGKKLPGAILPRIGQGKDDYSAIADWGMDILKVNQSLGMGGIGVLRGGKATQLGPSQIEASVLNSNGLAVVFVQNRGFAGDGGTANLRTLYSIAAGSRLTEVTAVVPGHAPVMVAGLTLHPGVTVIRSGAGRYYRYVASWGAQSLAGDNLGLALFYPAHLAQDGGDDGASLFVRFCDRTYLRYSFAAVWSQEPGAPQTEAEFREWLETTAAELSRHPTDTASHLDPCPAQKRPGE